MGIVTLSSSFLNAIPSLINRLFRTIEKSKTYNVTGKFLDVEIGLAVGMRDLDKNVIEVARRDEKTKERVEVDGVVDHIEHLLVEIQDNLFNKAKAFRDENIRTVEKFDKFKKILSEKGGFISAHWDGTKETEEKIKTETKATIRCIPLDAVEEEGVCVYSGKISSKRVLFAKAY